MPCYYPIDGWRAKRLNENGNREIVFNAKDGYADMPVGLPCGQCIGCRLERSRQWAVRCVHESSLYSENSFITLTYNNESLPAGGSLVKADFQKFMKRLRKHLSPLKIRYYMCGEYGEVCENCGKHESKCHCRHYIADFGRPHFHALIFGYDFPDKILHSVKNGNLLYKSDILNKIWGKGFCIIGEVTFESAAYVARYVMKKALRKEQIELDNEGLTHYERLDKSSGEISYLIPEYTDMSRGRRDNGDGGIGFRWFEKYKKEVYPNDYIVLNGKKMKPPKYYKELYKLENPDEYIDVVNRNNKIAAFKSKEDNTLNRLRDREIVKKAQLGMLKRDLEEEQ